jgi:hypothetical protein
MRLGRGETVYHGRPSFSALSDCKWQMRCRVRWIYPHFCSLAPIGIAPVFAARGR